MGPIYSGGAGSCWGAWAATGLGSGMLECYCRGGLSAPQALLLLPWEEVGWGWGEQDPWLRFAPNWGLRPACSPEQCVPWLLLHPPQAWGRSNCGCLGCTWGGTGLASMFTC